MSYELTKFGKIFSYTGVFKESKKISKSFNVEIRYTRIRILHPIGFIIFIIYIIYTSAKEGFLRKGFISDIKSYFILF